MRERQILSLSRKTERLLDTSSIAALFVGGFNEDLG